jgi:two-component system alkaline phosphatase synthesis response regulator PhoP
MEKIKELIMKIPLILITDDEEMITQIVEDGLQILRIQSDFKVEVEVSEDPTEALRLIRTIKYDLLILDHRMPFIKGSEIAKEIRLGTGPNKNTPILFISGYISEVKKETRGLEDIHYLNKPLIFQNLISLIQEILGTKNN